MADMIERRGEWAERPRGHIGELRKRAAEADVKLKRPYEAIEAEIADLNDPILNGSVTELMTIRDQALGDAERAAAAIERLGPAITPGEPSGAGERGAPKT